jgi:hypothetical protein
MNVVTERRSSPRFPTVKNLAIVELRTRAKSPMVDTNLVNISITGALLRMRGRPKIGEMLWLALMYPVKTRILRATVVRIGADRTVGVAFAHACNPTFFWTATRGEDFRTAHGDKST